MARLQTLLDDGQYAAASKLVERELGPALEKLEDMLGELVERKVAPYRGMPVVEKVMGLCREFQKVHRPEFQRPVTQQ